MLFQRPDLFLYFHEDNETAISIMQSGYSQSLRHIQRTHGINLRALHERFKEPWYHLMYQRSALMSADIYTKGFPLPPAWQLATRLINHIDPDLFWGGRRASKSLVMPSEHKGGLEFDYWVSNPWLNHTVKSTTTTTSTALPGVLSGVPTPNNNTTPLLIDGLDTEADDAAATAQSVMEDTFHECKSDDSDAEQQADIYYDVELPVKACHDDACFNSGVDDSVVMGSVNPPSARNPPLEDEPVAASPRQPLQQNFKKMHVTQQRKQCSRRHYRTRRQYTAACYWST